MSATPEASGLPAIVYWYGEYSFGGIETALVSLFRMFSLLPFRPVFVWAGARREPRLQRQLDALGIEQHEITPSPHLPFARPLRARTTMALLRKLRPALLHIHSSSAVSEGIAIGAAKVLGIPVIRTVHAPFSFFPSNLRNTSSAWQHALHRNIAKLVDRTMAVSAPDRAELLATGLFDPARLETLANGIEWQRFSRSLPLAEAKSRLGLDPAALVIGMVGRLVEQKQFGRALAAMPEVLRRHPTARLVLVGDGEEDVQLREQAAALGISGPVTFLGYRQDVPLCLAAFDVLAIPSLFESQGLIFLEGLAAGVAIVASDLPCFREMDGGAQRALFVDTADTAAFSAALLRLLDEPERRARQIAAGLTLFPDASMEAHVAKLAALYAQLTAARA